MQDSIFINVSHLPTLVNLSQYYHIKQIIGKQVIFSRILYKDNQQGNIYATKDGGLLLEPNQGKSFQIKKDDIIKESKDTKLEITDIPQGALITLNTLG
jgi:hypothetical protein